MYSWNSAFIMLMMDIWGYFMRTNRMNVLTTVINFLITKLARD